WVTRSIEPLGLHLSGPFRQFNGSPTFSLIRFETNGPAVWFKAVGEPNVREFPITMALGKACPNYVPAVIATRPDCNGWLTREVEGINLGGSLDLSLWTTTASTLARLQVQSL